jgi:hypothetical protein
MWDFNGQRASELSVKVGTEVDIIEVRGEWALAVLNGTQHGWVPANYIAYLS